VLALSNAPRAGAVPEEEGETMLVPIQTDPAPIIAAVLAGVNCANTRRAYSRALCQFAGWLNANGNPGLNRQTVTAWRQSLVDSGAGSATVNLCLSAVRRMVDEAAALGWLDEAIAASVARVRGIPTKGRRLGKWMTLPEAQALIDRKRDTLTEKRDAALIALLLGAALRRAEAVSVTVDQFQMREGHWLIVDLRGKGGKVASVVLAPWASTRIAEWIDAAGITEGPILRRVGTINGDDSMGESLSASGVAHIVSRFGNLAPHDYRRSAATLARRGDASWEQVRDFLRHSSVTTTERYVAGTAITVDPASQRMGLS
jgi:integrase/recombinase XerD